MNRKKIVVFVSMGFFVLLRAVWADPLNLVGVWKWNSSGYSGRLQIASETPDGRFTGKFINYASTIEGLQNGNEIQFVRRFMWSDGKEKVQFFKVTLVGNGNNLRMVNGSWTGFDSHSDNGSGDFSAQKISSPALSGGSAPGANDKERP